MTYPIYVIRSRYGGEIDTAKVLDSKGYPCWIPLLKRKVLVSRHSKARVWKDFLAISRILFFRGPVERLPYMCEGARGMVVNSQFATVPESDLMTFLSKVESINDTSMSGEDSGLLFNRGDIVFIDHPTFGTFDGVVWDSDGTHVELVEFPYPILGRVKIDHKFVRKHVP